MNELSLSQKKEFISWIINHYQKQKVWAISIRIALIEWALDNKIQPYDSTYSVNLDQTTKKMFPELYKELKKPRHEGYLLIFKKILLDINVKNY